MTQSTFKANEVPSFARVLRTIPPREFHFNFDGNMHCKPKRIPNKYQHFKFQEKPQKIVAD